MAQRIKGQDTEVRLVLNGILQAQITDIRSFEFTDMLDILRESYLGETTERKDEIFKGVSGRMTLHFEDPQIFDFAQSIVARAQRREPGTVVNVRTVFAFPSGARRIAQFNNVFFGNIPFNTGSRADYIESTLEFECESMQIFR